MASLKSFKPMLGKYSFLCALFFKAETILSGMEKGDPPKPKWIPEHSVDWWHVIADSSPRKLRLPAT